MVNESDNEMNDIYINVTIFNLIYIYASVCVCVCVSRVSNGRILLLCNFLLQKENFFFVTNLFLNKTKIKKKNSHILFIFFSFQFLLILNKKILNKNFSF
jgi:hypothetical protein